MQNSTKLASLLGRGWIIIEAIECIKNFSTTIKCYL